MSYSNNRLLGSQYTVQNLNKIHSLSKQPHKVERKRKKTYLIKRIDHVEASHSTQAETILATHNWIRGKMIILLKYVEIDDGERITENGAQKLIQGSQIKRKPSIYRYNG